MGGLGDGAGSSANAWEQVVLVVCLGPSAGCVEGSAVGRRGRVVGGPFARGQGNVYTYDFSSCFFPKFKKSTKRGFSPEMTYFFCFYGSKIGGGVLLS